MRVLLDTHAFLWFVLGDEKLSSNARISIEDSGNEKLVSPASYWEIAIKISLNKYKLSQSYEAFMQKGIVGNGFTILPIELQHTVALTTLPFHHRDPFDRLIIAQALVEQIPVISGDAAFAAYPVTYMRQRAVGEDCTMKITQIEACAELLCGQRPQFENFPHANRVSRRLPWPHDVTLDCLDV